MSSQLPTRRKQIIEVLELFSSEEEQLKYERDVPHVDITQELLSLWFDDQYHPELMHFDTCFTPKELNALEEFHRYYDERVSRLPVSMGTVRTWLSSPAWQEVMRKAASTLEQVVA